MAKFNRLTKSQDFNENYNNEYLLECYFRLNTEQKILR